MTDPNGRPTLITSNTYIKLGLAVAICGLVFYAGVNHQQVNSLVESEKASAAEKVDISRQLTEIKVDLAAIKTRLGLMPKAVSIHATTAETPLQ